MTKTQNISSEDILSLYMDYVVLQQTNNIDLDDFCSHINLKKSDFFKHYKSEKKLQKKIFKTLFLNSLEVLNESEEFLSFNSKNKLISLYFTFFENLTLNKDYVYIALSGFKNQLNSFKILSNLKKSFLIFIDSLSLSDAIIPIEGLEKFQLKMVKESSWIQLLITIKFWLDDDSESFEKTDIFIEKSINTSFELIENKFLKNAFDLAKFVYKEKFKSN